MPKVVFKANYRRTFKTREYETRVIDIGLEVEDDIRQAFTPESLSAMARELYESLEEQGDLAFANSIKIPDPRDQAAVDPTTPDPFGPLPSQKPKPGKR